MSRDRRAVRGSRISRFGRYRELQPLDGAWLGLGAFLGALLGVALLIDNGLTGPEAVFVGGVVVLMLMAGLAAALGPARRGLGIEPMEALREE